jgi:hypothetical protein
MADDNVFDFSQCPIPPVRSVPPEHILKDPRVSDPPPDIPDCPEQEIDPLPPDPPCPVIQARSVGFTYGCEPEQNPPLFSFTITKSNCCDFDIDIELQIPCPKLLPEYPEEEPIPFVDTASVLRWGFIKNVDCERAENGEIGDGSCDFDLEIDVEVHCPFITVRGDIELTVPLPPTVGAGYFHITITRDPETCDFDIDVDGQEHCPQLSPKDTPLSVPGVYDAPGTTGSIVYVFAPVGDDCDYELDITVNFPCPTIGPQSETKDVVFEEPGVPGVLVYTITHSGDCEYDVDIEVTSPCPPLTPEAGAQGLINFLGVGETGYIEYGFTRTNECDYDLEIELNIPCPTIGPQDAGNQGVVNVLQPPGTPGYTVFSFTKGTDCEYELQLEVNVPCPDIQPTSETQVQVLFVPPNTPAYITYVFTTTGDCDFNLEIEVEAPCPAITPVSPGVQIPLTFLPPLEPGYLGYQFVYTDGCNYELQIEAALPCGDIGPQATGTQAILPLLDDDDEGYLDYGFTPGPDCSYILVIEGFAPCVPIEPLDPGVQANMPFVAGDVDVGTVEYWFEKNPGCQYELVIEAYAPCPTIGPQAVPGAQGYLDYDAGIGTQGYLEYGFQKESGCQYILEIAGKIPCPPFTIEGSIGFGGPEAPPTIIIEKDVDPENECGKWTIDIIIPEGAQGAQGAAGSDGGTGAQGHQGHQGDDGAQGFQGFQGFQGDKLAIVERAADDGHQTEYLALACTEMPEVRFEDVVVLHINRLEREIAKTNPIELTHSIDRRFLDVCEPNSIVVTSCVPNRLAIVGADVQGDKLFVSVQSPLPVNKVVVTLSGIRRGYTWRFRQHTAEEAEMNRRFWSGWRTSGS